MRRRWTLKPPIRALAMLSGLVATLALCPSALAAFPGQNGPIAFMSGQAGGADIYTMAADGSGQSRLTTDPNQDHEPAFSPDGQQIVFTSWRHGNPEIYVMNADGSGQTRLTNNADFDQHPSFSPDGQRIVFTSNRGFGGSGIYVMAADGSGQTPLTSNPGGGDAVPVFSPDGQRIAFARKNLGTSGYFEIFTMAADGTDLKQLTSNIFKTDAEPDFSPDGQKIVFSSDRDGPTRAIYTMNVDGSDQTRLTGGPVSDVLPAFSPDGERIVFERNLGEQGREIFTMAADGSNLQRLTTNAATDAWPDWGSSPGDTSPPTIQCGSADGAWHAADVSIACTASDGGSGLADPGDASFSLSTNVAVGTEDANASTNGRQVCDKAGNCATAGPISGNMVDKKDPAVSIARPGEETYLLNQLVSASYSCADGGSGIASCSGPVADGGSLDTASVGTKGFTVSATDGVGNEASQTITYVVAYDVFLLYDPPKPTWRIKLQLHDALGANVSGPTIVLTVQSIDGSTGAGGTFAYRNGVDGYLYVVDTRGLSSGSHTLEFKAGSDPTVHSVPFTVR